MAMTPLEPLVRTAPTFRTEVDTFFLTDLPAFVTEANELEANVVAKEESTVTAAATATAKADEAGASATNALAAAAAAAAAAVTATNAPGTNATSTSSLTIGSGEKTLTIQAGKDLALGMSVKIASSASPTNWMHGDITAYDSGTGGLTVNVATTSGSGTFSAWVISLSAPVGSLDFSSIANKPTTLDGYGITDAEVKNETLVDKGTVSTGVVTFDASASKLQRLQVGGALTIAVSNWPATGKLGELLIEGVNLGAATITWPTIKWVKADGTTTTTFASNGVTLQASGTDWVLLWTRDGGTTIYGKVMR